MRKDQVWIELVFDLLALVRHQLSQSLVAINESLVKMASRVNGQR